MKKQKPLVSIGLTTYQRYEGLKRALESLTSQTYKNLEIIISENYSSGFEAKEKYIRQCLKKDRRISYWQHKPDRGPRFNAKFALQKATGKYFMILADDDYLAPRFIATMVDTLEKNPEAGVAMSGIKVIYGKKPPRDIRFLDIHNPNPKNFRGTLWEALHAPVTSYNYFICGLFRREIFRKVFPQVVDIYTPDVVLIIFFSLIFPFRYVDEMLFFCDSWDTNLRKGEKPIELNIFSWKGEFSVPPRLAWAIIKSKQIPRKNKLYLPIVLGVLYFRFGVLMVIGLNKFFVHTIEFIILQLIKIQHFLERLQNRLYRKNYCSK